MISTGDLTMSRDNLRTHSNKSAHTQTGRVGVTGGRPGGRGFDAHNILGTSWDMRSEVRGGGTHVLSGIYDRFLAHVHSSSRTSSNTTSNKRDGGAGLAALVRHGII